MHSQFAMIGKIFVAFCLAALLGGMVAGCGQKGDLYLPEKKEEQAKSY